jgi:hypothetical protein
LLGGGDVDTEIAIFSQMLYVLASKVVGCRHSHPGACADWQLMPTVQHASGAQEISFMAMASMLMNAYELAVTMDSHAFAGESAQLRRACLALLVLAQADRRNTN